MIVNKDITEFIADNVLASTDIESYCQTNFSKSLMVLIGVDDMNPPDITDLPCLVIEPTIKSVGDKNSNFDYEIALHLGIKGKDKPTITGNKVVYDGVYQIEELGNLIVDLMKSEFAMHSNMDTFDISFYQDEINAFPTYSGVVLASMSVPNVIGENKIIFSC